MGTNTTRSPNNKLALLFFFSSRRRHTRWTGDWEFRRVLFRSCELERAAGRDFRGQAKQDGLCHVLELNRLEQTGLGHYREERQRSQSAEQRTAAISCSADDDRKIGRASCRERVENSVDAATRT